MIINISPTIAETAKSTAACISQYIRENPGALLCFAAGDTPLPIFHSLIEMQNKGEVDLSSVFYVGLDEWVGLGRETIGSCAQVMFEEFYEPAAIPSNKICVWDGLCTDIGAERTRIESWIKKHGNISLAMLGIGMNGHIGFNEPYTDNTDSTVFVPLDSTTKAVSVKYFKDPTSVEYGVGISIGGLKKANKLLLIATGPNKAKIVKKVLKGERSMAVPASMLTDHSDITLFADADAVEFDFDIED